MLEIRPDRAERGKESEVNDRRFVPPEPAGVLPIHKMQNDNYQRDQQRRSPFEPTKPMPGAEQFVSADVSFFAIVIVQRLAPHEPALGRTNDPLLAIGIIG